eukprot:scaffold169689_cov38-Prasinocladus_malaysianus.AAC.1
MFQGAHGLWHSDSDSSVGVSKQGGTQGSLLGSQQSPIGLFAMQTEAQVPPTHVTFQGRSFALSV